MLKRLPMVGRDLAGFASAYVQYFHTHASTAGGELQMLDRVLSLYSNLAVAWVGALVADLVINKPLGWSPPGIEFRRAYLYDFNPVGLGAMLLAAAVACAAYAGLMGDYAAAFSPLIALVLSMTLSPLLAWATGGRYYLARPPETRWGNRALRGV